MRRLFIVAAVSALVFAGCQKPADILMGPYVNSVTDSSAKVLWVTTPQAAGAQLVIDKPPPGLEMKIDLRAAPIAGRPTMQFERRVRPEILHTALVSGLQAGQLYSYSVVDAKGRTPGSFQTAPPKGSRVPIRFVAYGDTRSYPQRHRQVINGIRKELPLAFLLNTGDLVASGTAWPLWKKEFFDPARDVLRRAALWPARGNHELDGLLYCELFDLPGTELYYSFDWGNVHFVVLDSGGETDEADPAMLAWLEQDLAAARADWLIVAVHKPLFDAVEYRSTWGGEDVLPILEKHGVDLVLAGHSHVYERFRPIGPEGRKPIIHVVTGGGGAPTYTVAPSPILEQGYSGLHYCVITVSGDKLEMAAKYPSGKTFDRLTLLKTAGAFQKEVLARALPTQRAKDLAFIISSLYGEFPEMPRPGTWTRLLIPQDTFPAGSTVTLSAAKDARWIIKPATFDFTYVPPTPRPPKGTKVELPPPFVLELRVPDSLKTGWQGVEPELTADLSVAYAGQTYTRPDAPIRLMRKTLRMLTPEPAAADVPRAAQPIIVDGRLDDWQGIPFVVLPSNKKPSRITRLAWRPEGLYAALDVPDKDVQIDADEPWNADALELFVEMDYGRSFEGPENPNALKCEVFPRPDLGPGKATVHVSYGRSKDEPEPIPAAWQKTATGYTLEFLLPAALLAPAPMADGTKIGFHYILHDEDVTREAFENTKGKSSVWQRPIYWGAVRLVEKR